MHVVAITTAVGCVALCIVLLRLWTRFMVTHSPGMDDVIIIAALISSIISYAFVIVENHYGLGIPEKDLSSEEISKQMHFLWFSVPFYNLSLILSKISGLFFFLRIFSHRTFRLCTWILMVVLVILALWMVLSGFVFCVPVSDFWNVFHNHNLRAEHCMPEGPVWFANAALQIFTDFVILLMPMPLLSNLSLPRRKKAGVILIFCVGICVIATSSVRLHQLTILIKGSDFSKSNSAAAVWSCVEIDVSLICACLPPLQPLFSRIFAYSFHPQPLHSSPASNYKSNTVSLTSDRKPSIYDHPIGPENGVFLNDIFFTGPASYSASVSKVESHQTDRVDEEGIRVVRELRIGSDTLPSPLMIPKDCQDPEIEFGSSKSGPSIEWDLGDFEFPDYKERFNAAI